MPKRLVVVVVAALAALVLLALPVLVVLVVMTSITGVQAAAAAGPCGPTGVGGQSVVVPSGPVRLPFTGDFTVTSEYGMRMHPTIHVYKLHTGIDFSPQPQYGPVLAAKAGAVQRVFTSAAEGNVVEIDHGAGLVTRYLHLSSTTVKDGGQVVAGQQIGLEGSTGRSTGPHLHFEVRINGAPTDPRPWLEAQGVRVPAKGVTATAPVAAATPSTVAAPTVLGSGPASAATGTASAVVGALPTRVGSWQGEQVTNAAQIIRAAQARGMGTWETTLAVNVAMSESSLTNLNHGDAARNDTIGLFQEGPERGPYEQRMNAAGATNIFLDYLLKVPNYRSLAPTIAAHKTQANADPYHYEPLWNDAVQMVSTLTADPSLLKSLPAGAGAQAPCAPGSGSSDLPPAPGNLPGLDGGACPATTSPAERGLRPATLRVLRCGAKAFPGVKTFYGVGGRPGPSDHPSGLAVDLMIENYRTPQGRAYGWQVANWTRAHAHELGIKNVIYDARIWSPQRDGEGWRPYEHMLGNTDDTLAHRDHVHISLNPS